MKQKYIISSLTELKDWVCSYLSHIHFKDVFLLYGDLGSGKTQMVSYFVEALKGKHHKSNSKKSADVVSSPTFSLHQSYKVDRGQVHHFDLYRLKSLEEIEGIGFWDIFASTEGGCIFVEWADRLGGEINFPQWRVHKVYLSFLPQSHCDSSSLSRRLEVLPAMCQSNSSTKVRQD